MPLSDQDVHLWQIPLTEAASDLTGLNAAELARAERLRCPQARATFLQTRCALRAILGAYLSLPPEDIAFISGEHGKPSLCPEQASLTFNVSHSAGLALIAVARVPVGVDLEWQRADLDWRELLPVCCHPRELVELVELSGLSEAQGRERLLRLWTAKEAYLKGRGEGLHLPLDAVHLDMSGACWRPALPAELDDDRDWWIHPLPLPPGYCGSLATPLPNPLIQFRTWPDA